jgi:hypothetical protein
MTLKIEDFATLDHAATPMRIEDFATPEPVQSTARIEDFATPDPVAPPAAPRVMEAPGLPGPQPPVDPREAVAQANREAIARADAGVKETPMAVRVPAPQPAPQVGGALEGGVLGHMAMNLEDELAGMGAAVASPIIRGVSGLAGLVQDPTGVREASAKILGQPVPDISRPGRELAQSLDPVTKLASQPNRGIAGAVGMMSPALAGPAGALVGGAGLMAGNEYSNAMDAGASTNDATAAGLGGAAIGTATGLIPGNLGGIANPYIRTALGVARGAAIGGAQQAATNAVAQQTYDPKRPMMDGVGEMALIGGLLGGAHSLADLHARLDQHVNESINRPRTPGGMDEATARTVLDLPPGGTITAEQLRKAYRAAAMTTHPDKGGSPEAFQRVYAAQEALGGDIGRSGRYGAQPVPKPAEPAAEPVQAAEPARQPEPTPEPAPEPVRAPEPAPPVEAPWRGDPIVQPEPAPVAGASERITSDSKAIISEAKQAAPVEDAPNAPNAPIEPPRATPEVAREGGEDAEPEIPRPLVAYEAIKEKYNKDLWPKSNTATALIPGDKVGRLRMKSKLDYEDSLSKLHWALGDAIQGEPYAYTPETRKKVLARLDESLKAMTRYEKSFGGADSGEDFPTMRKSLNKLVEDTVKSIRTGEAHGGTAGAKERIVEQPPTRTDATGPEPAGDGVSVKDPKKMSRGELLSAVVNEISSSHISTIGTSTIHRPWDTKTTGELREALSKRRQEVQDSKARATEYETERPYVDAVNAAVAGPAWKKAIREIAERHGVSAGNLSPSSERGDAAYSLAKRLKQRGIPIGDIQAVASPEPAQAVASGGEGGRVAAPPAKQPWEMTRGDYLRSLRGVTNEQLGTYVPEQSVSRVGNKWTFKQVSGNDSSTMYPTRKLAVEAAKKHFAVMGEAYANPEAFSPGDANLHESRVADAVKSGKPVPPEVLADYPGLAPKPDRETDYFKGDKIEYTGKITPDGFREFTYLEGHKQGQTGVNMTKAEKDAVVESRKKAEADQQDGFRRLREPVAPSAPDSPEIARAREALRTARAYLASGKDSSGKKLTAAQKVGVQKAIKDAQAKLDKLMPKPAAEPAVEPSHPAEVGTFKKTEITKTLKEQMPPGVMNTGSRKVEDTLAVSEEKRLKYMADFMAGQVDEHTTPQEHYTRFMARAKIMDAQGELHNKLSAVDPGKLKPGDQWELDDHIARVEQHNDDGTVTVTMTEKAKSWAGATPEPETFILPADKPLPANTGTVREAAPEAPAPKTTGRQLGLLGEQFDGGITGSKTGDLFPGGIEKPAEPVDNSTDAKIARQYDPKATEPLPFGGGSSSGGGDAMASPEVPMADLPNVPLMRGGRIAPAPMKDGGPLRSYDEIRADLEKALGKTVRAAQPSRGAIGTYYPSSTRTVVGARGNLDTTFHEIAHLLDDRYGIVSKWATPRKISKSGQALPQKSPFDDELRKDIFQQTSRSGYKVRQKRAEGVAEFIRAWMVNPDAAVDAAPKFTAWFQQSVPGDVRNALRAAGDDIRRLIAAGPEAMTKANIRLDTEPKTFHERMAHWLSPDAGGPLLERIDAAFRDDLAPLVNDIAAAKKLRGITDLLPQNDPLIRIRNYAGTAAKVEEYITKGPIDANGRSVPGIGGVDWIVEPLKGVEPAKARSVLSDALALGVSERAVGEADLLDKALAKVTDLMKERVELRQSIREAQAAMQEEGADSDASEMMGSAVDRLREVERELKKTLRSNNFSGPPEKFGTYVARKKPRLTGAGAGFYPDDKVAAAAVARLKADPNYPAAAEVVKRYRAFAGESMKLLRDTGRISEDQYKAIVDGNEFYFSWKRVMDDVASVAASEGRGSPGGSRRMASAGQPVKSMAGAQRTIDNPLVSLIENAALAVREAERNAALRSFFTLLDKPREMYRGTPVDFDHIASRATQGDNDTIRVWRNGKAEFWQPRAPLYRALKGIDADQIDSSLARAGAAMVAWQRGVVTLSPAYMIRNLQRDQVARYVVSDARGTPADSLRMLMGGELAQTIAEMHRHGGGNAGFFGSQESYRTAIAEAVRKAAGEPETLVSTLPKMMNAARHLQRFGEEITRGSEYAKARQYAVEKLGYGDYDASLYAAHQARSLQDFSVAGRIPRTISRFITPFVAGGARGLFKIAETTIANPKRTAFRVLVAIGTMELLSAAWNKMAGAWDEEKDLPSYRKDFFWNFKAGPYWIAVPRPWELGLPGAAMRRAGHAAGGDANAFEGFASSAGSALAPVDVNNLVAGPFRTVTEQLWNHNSFTGLPIVPSYEADVKIPLRRGTDKASIIGRGVQAASLETVDSRRVDHAIKGMLGWTGEEAINMADALSGKPGAVSRLGARGTGMYFEAPGGSPDVEAVMTWARENRKSGIPPIVGLQKMLSDARNAPTAGERETLTRKAHEVASRLRKNIEANEARKRAAAGSRS